ncbi:glycosyltransferase, partial [Acinetobacter baumannii]|uniref:glycosyltransferase n=2 Tax=Bacteria TaxID=2 RepID=UPI0022DE5D6C|nr:glycosyltransferase [Acinetobacter baumannii]
MLIECARELDARVLHTTTDFKNAQIVSRAAEKLGVPWVYEVRGELENTWLSKVQEEERGIALQSEYYKLARARETEAMKAASAVVVLSEVSKANLVTRGVEASKIFVVPNAIDDQDLYRDIDVPKLRTELEL